jgi:hypothetical protein
MNTLSETFPRLRLHLHAGSENSEVFHWTQVSDFTGFRGSPWLKWPLVRAFQTIALKVGYEGGIKIPLG